MSRRRFMEHMALLAGASVVGMRAQAATPVRIELQRSAVAGFQYHDGAAVWPLLFAGAALDLVREPDNVHDKRAVRVDWQGRSLGYVPRIDNAAVAHLLDGGQRLSAEIVILRESNKPWARVEFAVYLQQ